MPIGRHGSTTGELLDVRQTASLLGLSEKAVRSRVDRRLMPFRRLGGRVVFVRAELDAFVAALEGCGVDEAIANLRLRRGQT
jgi:excisionase family DNA binding protein